MDFPKINSNNISLFLILFFLIVSFGFIYNITHDINHINSQEKINTAILSTQLSSYGWKNSQDVTGGLLSLGTYINSVKNTERKKFK